LVRDDGQEFGQFDHSLGDDDATLGAVRSQGIANMVRCRISKSRLLCSMRTLCCSALLEQAPSTSSVPAFARAS
jgi:hypothetical protein